MARNHAVGWCTVLALVSLVVGCGVREPETRPLPTPPAALAVIAHRGAHAHAPENTLPSFQAAIALGADYVELDLQTTKDGGLVIIHNSTVDARTNGTGAVRAMTLAQMRALDAGVKFDSSFIGTRIPTADEAFAFMKGKVGVYLDVKDAAPESVVALVRRHDMLDETIVYDDTLSLAAMRRIEPRIRAMVPRPPTDAHQFANVVRRIRPEVFGSSYREITPGIVDSCHRVGAMVFVNIMAADNPDGWNHGVMCGADALETDRPEEVLAFLRGRGLHK